MPPLSGPSQDFLETCRWPLNFPHSRCFQQVCSGTFPVGCESILLGSIFKFKSYNNLQNTFFFSSRGNNIYFMHIISLLLYLYHRCLYHLFLFSLSQMLPALKDQTFFEEGMEREWMKMKNNKKILARRCQSLRKPRFLAAECPVLTLTQVGLHPSSRPYNNLNLAAALVLFFMSRNRILFGDLD